MSKVLRIIKELIEGSGSTWISEKALFNKGITQNQIKESVNEVKEVICCEVDNSLYFTTNEIAIKENEVAEHALRILLNDSIRVSDFFLNKVIAKAEETLKLQLHEQQKEAVIKAVRNNLCIITGGPGTGKTCVLNVIHYVLTEYKPDYKIRYYAPTGKAASRITESTKKEASTLHKGMKLTTDHADNPQTLDADIIIVDEISMLDIFVASALMRAVKSGSKLILVGDIDQLPSVGPGAVLRDMIESDCIPVARLTKTFRQANECILFQNIQNIQASYPYLDEGKDFHVYYTDEHEDVTNQMVKEYLRLVKKYGKDNVICLMPYHVAGKMCTNIMNEKLQSAMNPRAPYFVYRGIKYRLGDPVMQLKNRLECANGDVGKIVKIASNGVVCKFFSNTVYYENEDMDEIELAYAMSIHKSQGSEYSAVVTCLYSEHERMLLRNLLYTAITRAKKECTLYGDEKSITKAIRTDGTDLRFTMLAEKLQYYRKRYLIACGK